MDQYSILHLRDDGVDFDNIKNVVLSLILPIYVIKKADVHGTQLYKIKDWMNSVQFSLKTHPL